MELERRLQQGRRKVYGGLETVRCGHHCGQVVLLPADARAVAKGLREAVEPINAALRAEVPA